MSQRIPNLYITNSPLGGKGVFVAASIPKGSLIEVCPIIFLPEADIEHIEKTQLYNYYFQWKMNLKAGAIALGYGSLYNHSFKPNAYYEVDFKENELIVSAYTTIEPGDEILFNYNCDPEDQSPLWFQTR